MDKIAQTDTAVTGNTRVGLRGVNGETADDPSCDDLEAADIRRRNVVGFF